MNRIKSQKLLIHLKNISKYTFIFFLIIVITLPSILEINAQTNSTNPALTDCIPDPIDQGLNCTNASDMVEKGLIIPLMGVIRRAAIGRSQWKYDEKTGSYSLQQIETGAVSVMANYMGDIYRSQPASFVAYLGKKYIDINPVKATEAQSIGLPTSGAAALGPIYSIWEVIRNLTYIIFTVYFIIIAFMILFRQKLGGQDYVSIVNSIPKVIMALVLVTFSLPLAGLMIDIGNICNSLTVSLFSKLMPGIGEILEKLNTIPGQVQGQGNNVIPSYNIISLLNGFLTESFTGVANGANGSPVTNSLYTTITFVIQSLASFQVPGNSGNLNIIQGPAPAAGQNPAGVLSVLGTSLLSFLFSLTFLQSIFKIFFGLIINYVELILKIIFSPVQLIGTIFNGTKSLTGWIRSVLSNVLVFPAIFLGLVLISIFTYTGGKINADACLVNSSCYTWAGGDSNIFNANNANNAQVTYIPAPLGYFSAVINNKTTPLSVNGFISLGLLLFLPEIIDITKRSVASGSITGLSGDSIKNNIGKFASKIPLVGGLFK